MIIECIVLYMIDAHVILLSYVVRYLLSGVRVV